MQLARSSVKVTVYWGDILYDTVLCERSSSISVGRKLGNTFLLDLDKNTPVESFELLKINENNLAEVQFDDTIEGHVRLAKGFTTPSSAIKKNEATRLANGMYQLVLSQNETAELVIGHVSFHIDWVKPSKPLPKSTLLHRRNLSFLVVFFVLALPLAALLKFSYNALQEETKLPERLVPLLPPQMPKVVILPPKKVEEVPEPKPVEVPIAEKKVGRSPPKPKSAVPPPIAKPAATPSAAQSLQRAGLGSLVKGLTSFSTGDAPAALNRREEEPTGQSTGGGLFSAGLKSGGKTVGLGRPMGSERGFEGSGRLGLSDTMAGATPLGGKLRRGIAESVGLSRGAIDHIVRQKKDRVRLCFERQLNSNPNLSGKITVHFEIDASGNVMETHLTEDTLKNVKFRSCVLEEVRSWIFPKPDGGVVVPVDYPFTFESTK